MTEGTQATENQEGTQGGENQQTSAEDTAAENAKLKQQIADQDKRLGDKDRYINELSTEKSTLETRLTTTQVQQQQTEQQPKPLSQEEIEKRSAEILEISVDDPQAAAKKQAALLTEISKGNQPAPQAPQVDVNEAIQNNLYAEKVKTDNEDLVKLGFEPVIVIKANQLMQKGKSYKDAVDAAVAEVRENFKANQSTTQQKGGEQQNQENQGEGENLNPKNNQQQNKNEQAPAGSQGESSANTGNQAAGGKKEDDDKSPDNSLVDSRKAAQMGKGL